MGRQRSQEQQEETAVEMKEMTLKAHPDNRTPPKKAKMNDHGFSHKSDFASPRAPQIYKCARWTPMDWNGVEEYTSPKDLESWMNQYENQKVGI